MAAGSSAAPGAPPGTPLLAERGRDPESTRGWPRARGRTPRIDTHRPSASSCPHCHSGWVRRNQALTRTWWHLPRVGEQRAIRTLAGQGLVGWTEVFLSPHTHTPHRGYRNQQPQHEACTGTGQTTQAWGPELPRAPDTSASPQAHLREGHGSRQSPQHNQPGWDGLHEGLRGEGRVSRVGGWQRPEGAGDLSEMVPRA